MEINEYFRGAVSGTGYGATEHGTLQWHTSREQAVSDTAALALRLGPSTNVGVQAQVMTSQKADALNAAIEAAEPA